MNVYIARLLAFDADKLDVIQQTLESAEMRQLIFPARIYTNGENRVVVKSVEHVVEMFNEKQAEKKPILVLTLYCENGLELSFTFYFTGASLPTVILLKFTGEHIRDNIVTTQTFSQIIEQGIAHFNLDHATVYDDATIPYPHGLKYFKGHQGRRFPIQLGWLSYFRADLVDIIGRDKFEGLQGYDTFHHSQGGISLTVEKDGVLFEDSDYQTDELKVIEQLGLTPL